MKTAVLALALVAGAHAIEMTLETIPGTSVPASTVPAHVKASVSHEDFTLRCPAGQAPATCQASFPSVVAKDHNGLDVGVTERTWQMIKGDDNTWSNTEIPRSSINYDQVGTYLLTFDANDAAGNPAEQLVFALMIDDNVAPAITLCPALVRATPIEAGDLSWSWCQSTSVDAVDGDLSPYITYDVREDDQGVDLTDLTFTQVQSQMNRWTLGEWHITLKSMDDSSNTATTEVTLTVQDTTDPAISVVGRSPVTDQQCNAAYEDGGYSASDTYDDHFSNTIPVVVTIAGPTDNATPTLSTLPAYTGDYVITYTATDSSGRSGSNSRPVTVVDTHDPVLSLNGFPSSETHYIGQAFSTPTVTCTDTCDASPTLTEEWVPGYGVPADYDPAAAEGEAGYFSLDLSNNDQGNHNQQFVKRFTCTDYTGLSVSQDITYRVEDNANPTLNLNPGPTDIAASKAAGAWVDPGASCEDYSDGPITDIPVTYGATGAPNLRVPDTYTVTYACTDAAGNSAVPAAGSTFTRVVRVVDNNCPQITLNPPLIQVVEANFPWVDPGWTVEDDVTASEDMIVTKDDDTVNLRTAFKQFRSCAEIKAADADATNGEYAITVQLPDGSLDAKEVACDFTSAADAITYFAVRDDRLKPYHNDAGQCPQNGFVMASRDRITPWAKAHFSDIYFPEAVESSDHYLCTLDGMELTHDAHHVDANTIKYAKQGVYTITYHTKDGQNNTECVPNGPVTRKVVVKDTLPPVIVVTREGSNMYAASAMGAVQESKLSTLAEGEPHRAGIPSTDELTQAFALRGAATAAAAATATATTTEAPVDAEALPPLDINQAAQACDIDALDQVKYITASRAQDICDLYTAEGPFTSIFKLDDITGVGPTTVRNMVADGGDPQPSSTAAKYRVPCVAAPSTTPAGETEDACGADATGAAAMLPPLDLNKAAEECDIDALDQVKSITATRAQAICDLYTSEGPFTSIYKLDDVSGIGSTTVDSMQEQGGLVDGKYRVPCVATVSTTPSGKTESACGASADDESKK